MKREYWGRRGHTTWQFSPQLVAYIPKTVKFVRHVHDSPEDNLIFVLRPASTCFGETEQTCPQNAALFLRAREQVVMRTCVGHLLQYLYSIWERDRGPRPVEIAAELACCRGTSYPTGHQNQKGSGGLSAASVIPCFKGLRPRLLRFPDKSSV